MVLAIFAVISAIAAPRYQSAVARARLDAAAGRVCADIGMARSFARATSASKTVDFGVGGSSYQLVGYQNPDRPADTYTVDLTANPYSVALKTADFGGTAKLIFSGFGVPAQGGQIVLMNSWGSRTLTVSATTGEVTIQ